LVTDMNSMQVLAPFAVQREHVSTWAVPVQGIRMPVPASQLGTAIGVTSAYGTATANAAKRATRNDAPGGEAFEDPL
jgi:hypothetical protein